MALWVDDPDLRSDLARQLHVSLATGLATPMEIEPVVVAIGLRVADHPFGAGGTAAMIWSSVLQDVAQRRLMRALVEHVRDRVPMISADMATVLAAPRSGGLNQWYRCDPPERARLLGPGDKRALLDRIELGSALVQVTDDAPVVSIDGDPGQGKSHSRHLLRHVLEAAQPPWQLVVIDIAELWPAEECTTFSARDFIGELSAKLGLPRTYDEVVEHTEAKRIARELVTTFSGRYKSLVGRRVLFVDGLDRSNVGDDVGVAVAHLAREIETGELGDLRLVITGYRGGFAPVVAEVLVEDRTEPISTTHLALFFEEIGRHIGRPASTKEIDQLVAKTLDRAKLSDLLTLGREASAVAHEHFG